MVLAAAGPWATHLQVGTVLPWLGSFAVHSAAGTAPCVAPRTQDVPQYAAAATGRWSTVRAFAGVPVVRDDGELVATLSGFSSEPDHPSVTRSQALVKFIGANLAGVADVENDYQRALYALARADLLAGTDAPPSVADPGVAGRGSPGRIVRG